MVIIASAGAFVNGKKVGIASMLMLRGRALLPGEEAGGEGGDQDDAQGDGDSHHDRVHAVLQGLRLPPAHQVVHGDVQASARDQRDLGEDGEHRGRRLADPGHDLGEHGAKGCRQSHAYEVRGKILRKDQIHHPGEPAAQRPQEQPPRPAVEEDGKAQSAHPGGQHLKPGQIRREGGEMLLGEVAFKDEHGESEPEGHCRGDEQGLHQSQNAGNGVGDQHLPHGVGDGDAGDQHHDDRHHDLARVLPEAQQDHEIAQRSRDEGHQKGVEQPLQGPPLEEPVQEPHREAAQARAQGVPPGAAEEDGEAGAAEDVPQQPVQLPKLLLPGRQVDALQLLCHHIEVRPGGAQLPGQGVELLQAGEVVGVGHDADPPVLGEHPVLLEHRRQGDEGEDGEHLHPLRAVALEDAGDGVLHPAHLAA